MFVRGRVTKEIIFIQDLLPFSPGTILDFQFWGLFCGRVTSEFMPEPAPMFIEQFGACGFEVF